MEEWMKTVRREMKVRLRDLEGTVRIVCYLIVALTTYSLVVDVVLPRL